MSDLDDELQNRSGIHAVGCICSDEMRWLFREQPTSDMGIDAHIETIEGERASGKLIAMQIKSGPSYFSEEKDGYFVYRGDMRHLKYWRDHSLPVLLVLYDPGAKSAYWVHVNEETTTITGTCWKINVPKAHILGPAAISSLRKIADGPEYLQKLRFLVMAKPLMRYLTEGDRLFIYVEEWIHKSSGRGSITIYKHDQGGNEKEVQKWTFVYLPGMTYENGLPLLFPWAVLSIDEEYYNPYDKQRFNEECCYYDKEDQEYISVGKSFDEWAEAHLENGIRPYEEDDEAAYWRLEMTLSELGKAFLELDTYLGTPASEEEDR
jgi:hypothetical protein